MKKRVKKELKRIILSLIEIRDEVKSTSGKREIGRAVSHILCASKE